MASTYLALPLGRTQHGPNPRLHSCGTVSGKLSRGLVGLPPPSASPAAPALPRAAATATAAGAAPPPCQLLSCNGDWAAAAEVTPGLGSGAGPAPERTAESRSSGGELAAGERRPPLRLSFLPCRPADPGSRGEAGTRCVPASGRPGRAALGPVGAASLHPPPGPAGCTVGAEGGGDTLR